ncbi:hypothetical protein OESDEN_09126 [Oesophagostomum dentatum]|uniref:Uncharacterized protein n=1 Tax=Oesophagostomum dentatum TaxID=61180 RepID=A0A0B1T4D7_OESDE|nr:hypothetical protein OESDEN_09126 [Oesophagostomum dentatum]
MHQVEQICAQVIINGQSELLFIVHEIGKIGRVKARIIAENCYLEAKADVEHPLMRCQSYNVSLPGERSSVTAQRRLCTTSGPLLAYVIAHLFINLIALVAIQTSRYRALIPYIFTAVLDLLMSSAYLVVLFVQIIRGDQIENVRYDAKCRFQDLLAF